MESGYIRRITGFNYGVSYENERSLEEWDVPDGMDDLNRSG